MRTFLVVSAVLLVVSLVTPTGSRAENLFKETISDSATVRITSYLDGDTSWFCFKEILPGNSEFGIETNFICFNHSIENIDPPVLPDGSIRMASVKLFLRNNSNEDITLTIDSIDFDNIVRREFVVGPTDEFISVEDSPLRDGAIQIALTNPDETFTLYGSSLILFYNPPQPTDVADSDTPPAAGYQLQANYPNPFNPSTTISFSLPKQSHVNITVYNLLGQETKTLLNASVTAGEHQVEWDGTDDDGRTVATGIYLYRILADDFTQSRKMVLAK